MQADVTRQSFSGIVIQFALLTVLFWASSYYGAINGMETVPGFSHSLGSLYGTGFYLPGSFIGKFCAGYPTATVILSLLLIFANALLITRTVTQNLVYPTRIYLSSIFYIIVACGIWFPAYDLAAVLAAYLMVRASRAFISSFVRTISFGRTFKGAFFIGLTPLLEPQNAIYLLLVPIAMAIFRRGGRETIVAIFGSLLPTLFTAYLWWAFDGNFTGIFIEIWREFTAGIPQVFTPEAMTRAGQTFSAFFDSPAGILKFSGILLIAVTLIISTISFFTMSSDMRTRPYKINIFALWFLLLAFISILLPSRTCGNFPVLAIPAAITAPAFFVKYRSLIPLILYILIITLTVAANIVPIIANI